MDLLAVAYVDPASTMWELAQLYRLTGKFDRAKEPLHGLLDCVANLKANAQIVLALGQTAEKTNDYPMAVEFYRHALALAAACGLLGRGMLIPPPVKKWRRGQKHEAPEDGVKKCIECKVNNEPSPTSYTQANQDHAGHHKDAHNQLARAKSPRQLSVSNQGRGKAASAD